MKLGIIGNGFVGKATQMLNCEKIKTIAYDLNPSLCEPKGTTLKDIISCDLIFISVPTPMNKDRSCCLDIVESVFRDLRNLGCDKPLILRSTVPPGTSERLGCSFMPEFLTEKNCVFDFINNKDWIFGVTDHKVKELLQYMINTAFSYNKIVYNRIIFLSTQEAEMVKMFRNNFLTVKVSLCNELYKWCKAKDIDYETVRTVAFSDKRIGLSHTKVPGPDGKFGFGGTCFPKDLNSTIFDMKINNVSPVILDSVNSRNNNIDRISREAATSSKPRADIENIIIREARVEDAYTISNLVNFAYELGEDIKRKKLHRTNLEQITKIILSENQRIWKAIAVCGSEERIVGSVLFEPTYDWEKYSGKGGKYGTGMTKTQEDVAVGLDTRFSYMGMLSVDPYYQKLGVAKLLIRRCEEETIRVGNKRMVLCFLSCQKHLKRMYTKAGFEVVGRHEWSEKFKIENLRDEYHNTFFVEMSKTLI